MARKAPAATGSQGTSDILGLVLFSLALLLLAALFSYDRADLAVNVVPPNDPKLNWIGPVGAWIGYGCFFVLGAAAYLLPALLLACGLACFMPPLGYLLRAWPWMLLLTLASASLLHIYSDALGSVSRNLDSGSAGGFIGMLAHEYGFSYFGRVGATIVLATLYILSLAFLSNLQLFDWVRELWMRWKTPAHVDSDSDQLERQARALKKEADQLREQIEKSQLGPDLQPVPEPTVRDLSVPQPKVPRPKPKNDLPPSTPLEPGEPDPQKDKLVQEGDVIPAQEVAAATKADILGSTPPDTTDPGAAGADSIDPSLDEPADAKLSDPTQPGSPDTLSPQAETDLADSPASPAQAAPAKPKPRIKKPKPIAVASTPMIGDYRLPPIELLHPPDPNVKPTETRESLMANARLMQQTLAQFGIEVQLGDITKGPTITRYELHPAPGVKLEKIVSLTNNIAAALKAERIHILAPVPGKSSVGVEVPNLIKTKVIMRDLLESEEWVRSKARVPLALGKDVYGHPIIADLADMPHLLIAGSTGSGKSVCINAIIASLLYKFSPDQLRFVMIDPKVVELQQYNSLPHLVVPVVNDPKKVILALRWVVSEMEKRYQIFARVGVRNIKSFNERPKHKPLPSTQPELPLTSRKEKIEAGADGFAVEVDEEIVVPREDDIVIPEKLSYVVVIIDELADLMLVAPADVEMAIARITQMARAAGIHCIVATQRPSVDVITGVIKANIPARIAFQVAAKVDSRTILDAMGADKLLGKGDMLYLPPGSAKLTRAQGALITDQEIESIVKHISDQGKPSYELEIHQQLSKPATSFDSDDPSTTEDEGVIEQCIEVIRSEQKASVSLLQRRLRLGYTRAARIMDELELRGIVGPSKGAEPRDILIDLDGDIEPQA